MPATRARGRGARGWTGCWRACGWVTRTPRRTGTTARPCRCRATWVPTRRRRARPWTGWTAWCACWTTGQRAVSPGQWADRLDQALDHVLAAGDDRFDSLTAVDLVGQLRAAETDHACDVPLDAAAVADWLDQVVQEEVRTVSRVGGGIGDGRLQADARHALPRCWRCWACTMPPFRAGARAPAWDLLAAVPQRGDRDPVREDRQLFLDAILAAADRVILTATARNIRSNKDEPLSACVDEFLRVAAATVSDRLDIRETTYGDLIEDHPLQPFNAACFTGLHASFDTGHFEVARACQQRQEEATPFHANVFELPEAVPPADLELHEMIRILKDPWAAWLGSLGVEIPQSGDDPFALDREPVAAPAGLDRWHLQTAVIDAVLDGGTSFLEERLTADRLLPYGTLGTAMGRQAMQEAESPSPMRPARGGRPAAATALGVPRRVPAGGRQHYRHP